MLFPYKIKHLFTAVSISVGKSHLSMLRKAAHLGGCCYEVGFTAPATSISQGKRWVPALCSGPRWRAPAGICVCDATGGARRSTRPLSCPHLCIRVGLSAASLISKFNAIINNNIRIHDGLTCYGRYRSAAFLMHLGLPPTSCSGCVAGDDLHPPGCVRPFWRRLP